MDTQSNMSRDELEAQITESVGVIESQLERVIMALSEIQDRKLYQPDFKTWAEYYETVWRERLDRCHSYYRRLKLVMPAIAYVRNETGVELTPNTVQTMRSEGVTNHEQLADLTRQAMRLASYHGQDVQLKHLRSALSVRESLTTTGGVQIGGMTVTPDNLQEMDAETLSALEFIIEASARERLYKSQGVKKVSGVVKQKGSYFIFEPADPALLTGGHDIEGTFYIKLTPTPETTT